MSVRTRIVGALLLLPTGLAGLVWLTESEAVFFVGPLIVAFLGAAYVLSLKHLPLGQVPLSTVLQTFPGIAASYVAAWCTIHIVQDIVPEPVFWVIVAAAYLPAVGGGIYAAMRARVDDALRVGVSEKDLAHFVHSLFDSEEFLTTLRSTLPTGKDDDKYGFDHIPYLLHNIDERRRRFSRDAALFLRVTIILGVVFVALLLIFSYVILNESSVGDGRSLGRLRTSISSIRTDLRTYLSPDAYAALDAGKTLRDLARSDWKPKDQKLATTVSRIREKVKFAIRDSLYDRLREDLESLRPPPDTPEMEAKFQRDLEDAIAFLANVSDEKGFALAHVRYLSGEVNDLVDKLDAAIGKDKSRIPDLIKRIAITVAIASFFLAIIRYSARIYQEHQHQVYLAERDDLAVRQFYVALRSAQGNPSTVSIVLQEFMKLRHSRPGDTQAEGRDLSEGHTELIKKLLNILAKKV